MAKKSALGKGLGALLPEYNLQQPDQSGAVELKLTEVEPNKHQPRKQFDTERLEALAHSIETHGVIQPILVTKQAPNRYQIVAGERRWRAAKKAGLKTIPALICDYDSAQAAEVALIENLQREDLNPVEEAMGFQRLMDEFSLTQEKISERVSKSRSAIANSLRLLRLPHEVLKMIEDGQLTSGHAKAILSLKSPVEQTELAKQIVAGNMSVREAERYVQRKEQPPRTPLKPNQQIQLHLKRLEEEMAKSVGTKVRIKHDGKKGKVELEYYSNEDLERLIELLCQSSFVD